MSDTYTWPQRCPDLVQDVSLKRARIDDENNTSAIRTTISGVDEEHPLPVSITTVPGIDADHPLPVLEKSDKTQWFLRGYASFQVFYYRIQWFYVSPPLLSLPTYNNIHWVTVRKLSSDGVATSGVGPADLTQPPVYIFSESGNVDFADGWIAGYSNARALSNCALLGFKAGNTNFSSPDITIPSNTIFKWDGEDFMNCQRRFDSSVVYLQNAGGSPSDTAWSGTGDGTVISLLKGIANIF